MKFSRYLFLLVVVWLPVSLVAAPDNPTPQPSAIRLAVIGASIAAGFGTDDHTRDSYPSQLQRMLGTNWVVGNFGVSGTTLIHSGDAPYIKTPEYQKALAFKPDVLVIDLGGNDSKPFNYEAHPGDFIPDYSALVAAFRAVNPEAKIYAALPVPAFPRNYGIRDSVIVSNIIPAIVSAAAWGNFFVIDLHTPLAGQGADFPDHVHPNAEGAKLMAKVIFATLLRDFPNAMLPQAHAHQKHHSSGGIEVWQDIEYANINGHSLKLDLYIPQNVSRRAPLIIDIHGGGWMALDKNEMVARRALAFGFAVASIDYRLTPEAIFPAQIYDCKAAVRWLRAHAAEYGFKSDKIGAWGDSAGGHLVSLLGLTANHPEFEGNEGNPTTSSQVQAVCDFYGPSDFLSLDQRLADTVADAALPKLIGGLIEKNQDKARQASPIFYVTTNACPFLIVHGDQDPLVPLQQSIELNDALSKAGVPSQLYIVKGGGHGFDSPEAFAKVIAFFNKYLEQ